MRRQLASSLALWVAVFALSASHAHAGILEEVAFQGDDLRSLSVLERFSDRALAEAFASIGIGDSSEILIGVSFGTGRVFFPTVGSPGGGRCDDGEGENGCNDISDSDIDDFEVLGNVLAILHLAGPADGVLALFIGPTFEIGQLPVVDATLFSASRPIPEPASALAFAVGTLLTAGAVWRRRSVEQSRL